jgi:GTPase SAR1 family protein
MFQKIVEQLPVQWHADVKQIADKTIHLQTPLRVCIVGEFSSGKSSLINALLGENLLPSAREETTALPTFIEYAPTKRFELVNTDGTVSPLSADEFSRFTVVAPENALCSILKYPAKWLEGLSLIDLPGLGSQSQRHGEYTLAQISATDAIIYLLSPRGATQGDLKTLRIIKNYGKQVIIGVSQWDTIEESIAEGEHAPDLIDWQTQIFRETQLNLPLIGVSKFGHGRETVIDFLQDTKTNLNVIREQRFRAELIPLLTNALGQLENEQVVCASKNSEEIQKLHTELLNQKETLLSLKSELYGRSDADQAQLEQKSLQLLATQRQKLVENLDGVLVKTQLNDWQLANDSAHDLLQNHVVLAAQNLKDLSSEYGRLDLPEVEIKKFNLHLSPPEPIELDNFIDNSRLLDLQQKLANEQRNAETKKAQIEAMPEVQLDSSEQKIKSLYAERHAITSQELPRITQTIEGTNDGAQIGKTIGQIADIALIAVAEPLAILKVASMLGAGSKVVKTVQTVSKVTDIMNKNPSLTPIVNQLGFLEKLSGSYWGEQIGKSFDQPAQTIEIIDPAAEAERRQILVEQDKQIATQRAELHRLEALKEERDHTGWALEQHLKEQHRLQASIQKLQDRAQASKREAESEQIQQQKAQLERYRQQLINQNLLHFDQQTRAMVDLLRATCKRYWEEHVETMLTERLQTIETLNQQLQQAPEQRQAALAALQQQIMQIQTVLNSIKD